MKLYYFILLLLLTIPSLEERLSKRLRKNRRKFESTLIDEEKLKKMMTDYKAKGGWEYYGDKEFYKCKQNLDICEIFNEKDKKKRHYCRKFEYKKRKGIPDINENNMCIDVNNPYEKIGKYEKYLEENKLDRNQFLRSTVKPELSSRYHLSNLTWTKPCDNYEDCLLDTDFINEKEFPRVYCGYPGKAKKDKKYCFKDVNSLEKGYNIGDYCDPNSDRDSCKNGMECINNYCTVKCTNSPRSCSRFNNVNIICSKFYPTDTELYCWDESFIVNDENYYYMKPCVDKVECGKSDRFSCVKPIGGGDQGYCSIPCGSQNECRLYKSKVKFEYLECLVTESLDLNSEKTKQENFCYIKKGVDPKKVKIDEEEETKKTLEEGGKNEMLFSEQIQAFQVEEYELEGFSLEDKLCNLLSRKFGRKAGNFLGGLIGGIFLQGDEVEIINSMIKFFTSYFRKGYQNSVSVPQCMYETKNAQILKEYGTYDLREDEIESLINQYKNNEGLTKWNKFKTVLGDGFEQFANDFGKSVQNLGNRFLNGGKFLIKHNIFYPYIHCDFTQFDQKTKIRNKLEDEIGRLESLKREVIYTYRGTMKDKLEKKLKEDYYEKTVIEKKVDLEAINREIDQLKLDQGCAEFRDVKEFFINTGKAIKKGWEDFKEAFSIAKEFIQKGLKYLSCICGLFSQYVKGICDQILDEKEFIQGKLEEKVIDDFVEDYEIDDKYGEMAKDAKDVIYGIIDVVKSLCDKDESWDNFYHKLGSLLGLIVKGVLHNFTPKKIEFKLI